jgi:uncharacterized metal-binding protein
MEGQCAFCGIPDKDRVCKNPSADGKLPPFCSTKLYGACVADTLPEYESEEIHKIFVEAAKNEHDCYDLSVPTEGVPKPVKCRIDETIDFCKNMGYQKVGFAFCGALHKEASIIAKMFEARGVEVVSVMCKVGGIDKCAAGIAEEDKLHPNAFEPMCNPIAQAAVLNEAGTQFNVVIGLCVGHDSLFLSHSKAMCTVLAVKDRLLGHNPLAAVYTSHSFYQYLMRKK